MIGRVLPGGYMLLEVVGVGGMGRVYRAEQQALGRTVAVKVIHQHLLSDESTAARFITEARAASRLNHPNSVGVIDFGKTEDGQLYMVMEFLRGRDLARVIVEEGLLPMKRIVDVVRQVLAALAEAHDLNIIHRDLKPENIIIEPRRGGGDFVKVVDFGLAKMRAERSVTRPGIVCGTPDYMAPEQGRGDELDCRVDLYACGVVLFLLLTGRLPFEGDSPTQVVLMHLTMPPPDPRRVAPERLIPDYLADVCLKALAKDPKDRFQNADAFAAALLEQVARPKVVSEVDGAECPSCGCVNPKRQKFCGECGERLLKSTSTSADDVPRAPSSVAKASTGQRSPRMPSWPDLPLAFTARDDELAWLSDRLLDVKATLAAARVVAEDGFGKSRLVHEFVARARGDGERVVEVGPDLWWAEAGYFTLRRAIEALTGLGEGGGLREQAGASPEARRGLSEIFGETEPGASELSPESRRYMAAEALRWALVRATQTQGGRRRVVLVVDDLHRIDGASRNAICDVVSEPPMAPVLLLATHVPGFDAGWGSVAPSRVLSGIPAAAAAQLLWGRGGAPRIVVSDQARGVPPMYIEQIIHFTRDGGDNPPGRLADLLALRIERTAPDERRVLQAIAVLGDGAMRADVRALLPDSIDLDAVGHGLERAGMIALHDDGTMSIAHPLLRDVVTAMIPAAVRRELYAAAFRVSQERAYPLEAQALYALQAQDGFEALLLLEQVASRTASRGDVSGAIMALRRGLEVARREMFRGSIEDPTRAVVIFSRKLGESLTHVGNFTDADGVLREALDLAGPSGTERARVLGALSHVAHGRARDVEARDYLRQAIDSAERAGAFELVQSLAHFGDELGGS